MHYILKNHIQVLDSVIFSILTAVADFIFQRYELSNH
jgi:hypothetical protein